MHPTFEEWNKAQADLYCDLIQKGKISFHDVQHLVLIVDLFYEKWSQEQRYPFWDEVLEYLDGDNLNSKGENNGN